MSKQPQALGWTAVMLCVACGSGNGGGSDGGGSGTDAGVTAPTWTFSGGSASASFTSGTTPPATTIPAGGDVSASVSLQFAAPSSSGSLTLSTAENECCGLTTPDISPATLPADGANASGNPILYLSFYNAGSNTISFGSSTPAVTLSPTDGGLLATVIGADDECQLDLYETHGGASVWTAIPGASVMLSPDATTVTIPSATLPSGGTLMFGPGQSIAAISCD